MNNSHGPTAIIIVLLLLFLLTVFGIGITLSWLEETPLPACPSVPSQQPLLPKKKTSTLLFHQFHRIMGRENKRGLAFFPD